MPSPKVTGTLQPVRQKSTTRYDQSKGYVIVQEYESAGDHLGGLALQAQTAGMDYTHDANARKSRLVMSTTGAAPGFPEKATSTWQLYTNDYQKDIRKNPAAIGLGPVLMSKIDAAIQMIKLTAEQGADADPLLDGLAQTYTDFTTDGTGLF